MDFCASWVEMEEGKRMAFGLGRMNPAPNQKLQAKTKLMQDESCSMLQAKGKDGFLRLLGRNGRRQAIGFWFGQDESCPKPKASGENQAHAG
jgi:hypothetical protein